MDLAILSKDEKEKTRCEGTYRVTELSHWRPCSQTAVNAEKQVRPCSPPAWQHSAAPLTEPRRTMFESAPVSYKVVNVMKKGEIPWLEPREMRR